MLAFARTSLAITTLLIIGSTGVGAGANDASPVRPTLLASTDAVTPGSSFMLGLRMKLQPHWHTYWVNPGESGAPTQIKLTGPDGFAFGPIQWPLPTRIEVPGGVAFGYENEVVLLVPVSVSKDVKPSGQATLTAQATWLVCKETCIEGEAKLSLALPLASSARPANAELFHHWQAQLPSSNTKAIAKVEQAQADGAPSPALTVHWQEPPRKVEWFPVATEAVAVEDITVRHEGNVTRIVYKPTVYKADKVPGGKVQSVLVYEDAGGRRAGLEVPFRVRVNP